MLGINLVVHATKILLHDIWATVRLTVFPMIVGYGIAFVIIYLLAGDTTLVMMEDASSVSAATVVSFALAIFLAIAVVVFTFCWAAIGWHRFVLLEERPGALLPKLGGSSLKSYLSAGVRLIFVSVSLLIPLSFIVSILLQVMGSLILFVFPIISVAVYAVILRLSLVLPGAAIGKPMSLGESAIATSGKFATFIVVAVLLTVLGFLAVPGLVPGYVGLAFSIFLSWLSFALGISILTTLYGVYVEEREL